MGAGNSAGEGGMTAGDSAGGDVAPVVGAEVVPLGEFGTGVGDGAKGEGCGGETAGDGGTGLFVAGRDGKGET